MRTRFGRTGAVVFGAALLVGFAGGCGSDGGLIGNDGGVDGLPISTGAGGAAALDAKADQPTDVPEEHGPGGLGGAPGTAGASGTGGALGVAGMPGTGGMGTGGMGVAGTGAGGTGAGGTGVGGAGVGGMGAGGVGVGGTGVGGAGVGGMGSGGAGVGGGGVGGMGSGGTGVGGAGVGGTGVGGMGSGGMGSGGTGVGGRGAGGAGVGGATGVGGSTGTDAGVGSDGAVDAAPATLTQVWMQILSNNGASPAPGCFGCHDGSDTAIPDYTSVATSYATLVGVNANESGCPGKRVVAGDTETSVLINKLRSKANFATATVCGGDPMPAGNNRRISADQLHMIESWITAGALNN